MKKLLLSLIAAIMLVPASVKADEGIAITGEGGENKTGTQFYFELWKQGKPVNPEDVIIF